MATKVTLSAQQRADLDGAVLSAVSSGAATFSRIIGAVISILRTLPREKSDERYVDGALQRLRRQRLVRFSGGEWRAVHAQKEVA